MKKILFTALLLAISYITNAQDYKLFIDDYGKPTNSFTSATSYIVVKQLADSLWLMQQYDMENTILQSETFKDRDLKIPHGKYISYRKLNFYNNKQMKEWLKSDTANCIMTEGNFKDGRKDGQWTDYFIGGGKQEEVYYRNGVIDGPYRSFNNDHSTVALSGNYVDGKREGDWDIMNLTGQVIERDKYRKGKLYSRKIMISNYNSPQPPIGFATYINRAFRKAVTQQTMKQMLIHFDVTTGGKVVNPHTSIPRDDDSPLVQTLFSIIKDSPLWKPANSGDDAKPIQDFAIITVEIKNGEVTTKILDNANARMLFYNLTTEN
jgi:antitoxin component YwqK of YwqJK toxin-antitoxin module